MAKPGQPPKDERESKLAQALRANLRRRKAGTPVPPKPPSTEESS